MVNIQCRHVQFTNISAIIFDKDGTLENSQDFLRNLGIKRARMIDAQIPGVGDPLLMAFGINGDRLDVTGLMAVGSRWENTIAAAAYIAETGRGWLESLAIAQKAFEEADQVLGKGGPSPLFVGCLEVIKYLADTDLKLGILSAASTQAVENFVAHYQLDDYIQLKMGVDQGPSKPNPILFIQACEILGVNPAQTLMVGDSRGDVEMAKNAGAAGVIGISWYGNNTDHLAGADVVINQLDEIKVID
jgi:phosphoglycolate phosphatase